MKITTEQEKLESLAEIILTEIREQGGSINLGTRLESVFENNRTTQERVSRLLFAHGLTIIPYFDNPLHHRLTKDGWNFETFKKEREELEKNKRLEAEQKQSVIDTGKSVITSNTFQRGFGTRYLILTGFSALFVLINVYQQCRDKSAQQLQGIQKELQRIDTTLKHIQPFVLVKDSSYAPLPRHK